MGREHYFTRKLAWGLIASMLMTSTGITSFAQAITAGEAEGEYHLVKLHLDEGIFQNPVFWEKMPDEATDSDATGSDATVSDATGSDATESNATGSNADEDYNADEENGEVELINDLIGQAEGRWELIQQESPGDETALVVVDGVLTAEDIEAALEAGGYESEVESPYLIWLTREDILDSAIDLSGDGYALKKEETNLYAVTVAAAEDGLTEVTVGSDSNWMYCQDGEPVRNELVSDGEDVYYFNGQGYMHTGWYKFDEGWRFFRANGRMVANRSFELKEIQGSQYAFDEDGIMLHGWVSSAENRELEDPEGWKSADYYFGDDPDDGAQVTGWAEIKVYGGWKNETGYDVYRFYFDPSEDGRKLTDTEITDEDGIVWVLDEYGAAAEKEEVLNGWVEITVGSDSNWTYYRDGEPVKDELVSDGDDVYYFNSQGYMHTGWYKFDEGWRFFRANGRMVANRSFELKEIKGSQYAFDEDGIMLHGWVSSAENKELKDPEGWKSADYYFGDDPDDGAQVTGWAEIEVYGGWKNETGYDVYWFYFDPSEDGRKLTDTEITDEDGIVWVLDEYGAAKEKEEEPEVIDTSAISDAIEAANAAKNGITVSDSAASQISRGTKFVTTAEMQALENAIAKAEAAKASAATTEEAEAAAAELKAAVDAFQAAIKTGTRKSGGSSGGGSSSGSSGSSGTVAGAGSSYQWSQDRSGDDTSWKLKRADGSYVTGSIITAEDGSTRVQIAWALVNGAWYAFGADGYAESGWVLDAAAGAWYYVDINSGMNKGWHADPHDGRMYYLDQTSGKMHTGWKQIDGKWYYFNPTPTAETWSYDEETGKWFYLGNEHRPYGSMYRNEMTPDGYFVDENGVWDGK